MKIVEIKFGSHLYGTNTENSDLDLKSIYLPPSRAIILQRISNTISNKRTRKYGEKNLPGEVDEECFSLQRYLTLLSQGQTVALDMLFANEASLLITSNCWKQIQDNKDKLISKKSASFVGYCRQQANKYGIKGSRVHAVRLALELLAKNTLSFTTKLSEIWNEIESLTKDNEHMSICHIEQTDKSSIPHWNVIGRNFGKTTSIMQAYNCLSKIMDNYGKRALMAESQDGIDWKALSHAVRVAVQAIELFQTGKIIFPLANAKHILDIKTGKIPYEQVANEIEELLEKIEYESSISTLPDNPDYDFIDDFVLEHYLFKTFNFVPF